MDIDLLSQALEAASTKALAKTRGREVRTLKGVRGVPDGETASIAAAAWREQKPSLPDDEDDLSQLFGTAFEDGLVAVGLLAAMLPDAPMDVFDIGLDWLSRTDDGATADALGWLVLGPGALAANLPQSRILDVTRRANHPAVRRAGVMSAMALTGERIEGPAAAPLRERLGSRMVRFVDAPDSRRIAEVCAAFLRDEDPMVRKALRRLVRTWGGVDPEATVAWGRGTAGGLPRLIRDEILRLERKLGHSRDDDDSDEV